MKYWNRLTRCHPNSRVPFSLKVLIYACLLAFFGWSFVIFCLGVLGMDSVHNPYGLPIMTAGLVGTSLCLVVTMILWVSSFTNDLHRCGRNFLLTLAVTALLFYPTIHFWGLMSRLFDLVRPMLDAMNA